MRKKFVRGQNISEGDMVNGPHGNVLMFATVAFLGYFGLVEQKGRAGHTR